MTPPFHVKRIGVRGRARHSAKSQLTRISGHVSVSAWPPCPNAKLEIEALSLHSEPTRARSRPLPWAKNDHQMARSPASNCQLRSRSAAVIPEPASARMDLLARHGLRDYVSRCLLGPVGSSVGSNVSRETKARERVAAATSSSTAEKTVDRSREGGAGPPALWIYRPGWRNGSHIHPRVC